MINELRGAEMALLKELRRVRRQSREDAQIGPPTLPESGLTRGQRVADAVAALMGSWPFIIIQSMLLAIWISLNIVAWAQHWDPYPFILLNLALSFQAAYAAPFIMMSQNRQQDIDREAARSDYQVNIKAELEIELLHHKLDELRESEVMSLIKSVEELALLLGRLVPPVDGLTRDAGGQPVPE